jgi:Ca2+-binding RTX toxin-like protein
MRMLGISIALITVVTGGVLAAPSVARASAPPTCHGSVPTIVGTGRDDIIDGTPGNDVILGLGGNDTIRGLGGKDVICGNDGGDVISGGAGNDRIYGGYNGQRRIGDYLYNLGDTISGGPGDDLLDLGDDLRHPSAAHIGTETLSYANSATGIHLDLAKGTATGEGHDTIIKLHVVPDQRLIVLGSPEADVIKGTAVTDRIDPLGGNDVVFGRRGGDIIVENGLTPPLPAPNGDDVFHGGAGHDHLDTDGGHDVLYGGGGPDSLSSGSPSATLSGGAGGDHLSAGGVDSVDSANVMRAGGGDDHVSLFDPGPGTVVAGGSGSDELSFADHRKDPLAVDLVGTLRRGTTTVPVHSVEKWHVVTEASAVHVHGTRGQDDLILEAWTPDAPVTAKLGHSADYFWDRGPHPLKVSMGLGDDHLVKSGRGAITALLGGGDDLVETSRGHWAVGPHTPARSFNGGAGIDRARLDLGLPHNACTNIEKGNCPT